MRVRIVLAVALALVGGGVALALSQRAQRLAGTSFVLQRAFVAAVPAGGIACQPATWLAGGSAAAQLVVSPYGRRPLALSVSFRDRDGALAASGRVRGVPARGGAVTVPFAVAVHGDHPSTTACVRDDGADGLALSGDVASPGAAARVGGSATGGVVGFRYLRAGRESWWSLLPALARRFGLGKASAFGTWTLPVLALVVAGLWVATARLLVREARR